MCLIDPICQIKSDLLQPTAQPTFRWIMQKFQGIHWINLEGQRQISNLTDERRLIYYTYWDHQLSAIATHLVNHLSTCGM
jgi:hypothetical protein